MLKLILKNYSWLFAILLISCNNFKKKPVNNFKKNSFSSQFTKDTSLSYIFFGKIENQSLFYDFIGFSSSSAEKIIVFTKNETKKDTLIVLETCGSYVDEASVVKIKSNYFIYLNTNTGGSGNSIGYLYSVDLGKMKANEVKIKKSNYRLLKNLSILKNFELSKDENNNFSFGGSFRDEKTMKTGFYSGKYELVRIHTNQFVLNEKNEKLEYNE
jgi:hypothetical protein